ncbi:uncharacterized protein CIMG_13699 [Coccidioides immitis RS]|uniref:Uncharacterized protein n=1 Tax=Coccidioides immitis (strain RS) TaxID=246410 RepID=J3KB14_COCIM|nr:uncharacterized protein CIMG_13699 [Coccidioides immitis RS]EAS32268.3 hypothetical protein CIMG_13699 [Coccidioides immitis RS]
MVVDGLSDVCCQVIAFIHAHVKHDRPSTVHYFPCPGLAKFSPFILRIRGCFLAGEVQALKYTSPVLLAEQTYVRSKAVKIFAAHADAGMIGPVLNGREVGEGPQPPERGIKNARLERLSSRGRGDNCLSAPCPQGGSRTIWPMDVWAFPVVVTRGTRLASLRPLGGEKRCIRISYNNQL